MDRFEQSAETAALHAVMIEEPGEAQRILGNALVNELQDFMVWVDQLRDLIVRELHGRGIEDV